jgi:hypothetical protein
VKGVFVFVIVVVFVVIVVVVFVVIVIPFAVVIVFPQYHHMSLMDFVVSLPVVAEV